MEFQHHQIAVQITKFDFIETDMHAPPAERAARAICTSCPGVSKLAPIAPITSPRFDWRTREVYPRHAEARITLQKLTRVKCGSLSASTSALTLPEVVYGLCLLPSSRGWMV